MREKSMAAQVVEAFGKLHAVSFTHGYGQNQIGGSHRYFPRPSSFTETRDDKGRCTLWRGAYSDGSKLVFKWSEAKGGSVKARAR
jgi:hypothetical protein